MSIPNYNILFVCTGNICRSPTAQGIMSYIINNSDQPYTIKVDSAGIYDYHVGENPDARSIDVCEKHQVDIGKQIARQIRPSDFTEFDFIFAMDQSHLERLNDIKPDPTTAKIELLLDYTEQPISDVPDPYYGDLAGFTNTFNIIFDGCSKLVRMLRSQTVA